MKYKDLRQAFVQYFSDKQHQPLESSSLIPHNDPTLMFTNAGMNQFKDVFLGNDKRNYNRAVTIQKCLRAGGKHNDLENVGFTARHHTFFEMMGNFSFGDYFKKEAISFAWDFLTNTLAIPKDRLYVTVFETDDEAARIWHTQEGVPKDRIFRYGEKDNFWRMGKTGPCGPCSEIFYDHNPSGPKVPLDQDEDRFVEIWNLVFMQFFEDEDGKQTPLPKPSVDTGAGIERIAAALQGHRDNYQTDIFKPLIDKICELSGLKPDWNTLAKNPETLGAVKVVADHARSAAFLIGEGVLPSNEGKGYVLRRIMRRAIRYARKLNDKKSVYPMVCEEALKTMAEFYPVLNEKADFITKAVYEEEKRFLQTLDKGSEILDGHIQKMVQQKSKTLDGQIAFTLYDTYGFPFDLTELIVKEKGFNVDIKDFQIYMEEAKNKARKAHKTHSISSSDKHLGDWTQGILKQHGPTVFTGYDHLVGEEAVLAISSGTEVQKEISDQGFLIFSSTPFYAEGGGQVGDTGTLETVNGKANITGCTKINDIHIHHIQVTQGSIQVGGKSKIQVTSKKRQATANNHSATHLMHAALKKVLGDHVGQAGSLVNHEKLRFDFSHNAPVSHSQIEDIEKLVNEQISLGETVEPKEMGHKEALAAGAVAMFGEKYGDKVRVISMGDFSKELCGGTHVQNTSQVRLFKIISETGVSAGTRRIEALTGDIAFEYMNNLVNDNLVSHRQAGIKLPNFKNKDDFGNLALEIDRLKVENQKLSKSLQKAKTQSISIDDILKEAKTTQIKGQEGLALFTHIPVSERNVLSDIADKLRDKKDNIVFVLIGDGEGQKPLIVAASKKFKGVHAGQITKELCGLLDGKGGGRPDFAQGSAGSLDNKKQAEQKFYELIQ